MLLASHMVSFIQFCRNQPQQIEAQVLQWVMKGQSHEQEGSQTLELYSV